MVSDQQRRSRPDRGQREDDRFRGTRPTTSVSARAACICFCAMRPAKSLSKNVTAWPRVQRCSRDRISSSATGSAPPTAIAADVMPKISGRRSGQNSRRRRARNQPCGREQPVGAGGDRASMTLPSSIADTTSSEPGQHRPDRRPAPAPVQAPAQAQRKNGQSVPGGGVSTRANGGIIPTVGPGSVAAHSAASCSSVPRKPPDWRDQNAGVKPARGQQRGMAALFDDAALVQHHDPVHRGDGRQPVGDGDHGLALHHAVQRVLDRRLDLAVQRGGRLVQHQDRRVLQDHPRQRHPLPLAARQLHAAFADMGVIAASGPSGSCRVRMKSCASARARRRDHLVVGGIGAAVEDVVAHRAVQQARILLHHADLRGAGCPA